LLEPIARVLPSGEKDKSDTPGVCPSARSAATNSANLSVSAVLNVYKSFTCGPGFGVEVGVSAGGVEVGVKVGSKGVGVSVGGSEVGVKVGDGVFVDVAVGVLGGGGVLVVVGGMAVGVAVGGRVVAVGVSVFGRSWAI
jgi:hypothetical protein